MISIKKFYFIMHALKHITLKLFKENCNNISKALFSMHFSYIDYKPYQLFKKVACILDLGMFIKSWIQKVHCIDECFVGVRLV